MCQVCNQKCGYSRRHQLLEVNTSLDSTKLLSRHLTLSMHLRGALTYVLLYKEELKYLLRVKLMLKCFVEMGPILQLSLCLPNINRA